MLRTLGQYIGMIRRQANEFKQQFNDAIKDTELDEIRKEVDAIRSDTAATVRDVQSSVRVSDSDIGAGKASTKASEATGTSQGDPTWMTEQSQPSPAETAARAAAERAERLRSGGTEPSKPAASPSSGETQTNGATRPHTADAGA